MINTPSSSVGQSRDSINAFDPSSLNMLLNKKTVDSEAQIEAMATRVSRTELMSAIYMEELPDPHRLKNFTKAFLIPESILCLYLVLCLVYSD